MSESAEKPKAAQDKQWVITEEDAGQRLDRFLADKLNVGRAKLTAIFENGHISLNGRRIRKSKGERITKGMQIRVAAVAIAALDERAQPDPEAAKRIRVVYEDEHLVGISKPAGMASHPLRAGELGSVCNALLALYPQMASIGYSVREPGIVHRLDTGTSGVMLAAKDVATFEQLRQLFSEGKVEKRYAVLCEGALAARHFTIEYPIADNKDDPSRVVCVGAPMAPVLAKLGRPREAVTEVLRTHVLRGKGSEPDYTLAIVRIMQGARHQIRAHFSAIDHPIAGDTLYRARSKCPDGRHALHALELRWGNMRVRSRIKA